MHLPLKINFLIYCLKISHINNVSWSHPLRLPNPNFLPNPFNTSSYQLHACFFDMNSFKTLSPISDAHMHTVVESSTVIWAKITVTIPPNKCNSPCSRSLQLCVFLQLSSLLYLHAGFLKLAWYCAGSVQVISAATSSCGEQSCHDWKTIFHSTPIYPNVLEFYIHLLLCKTLLSRENISSQIGEWLFNIALPWKSTYNNSGHKIKHPGFMEKDSKFRASTQQRSQPKSWQKISRFPWMKLICGC